MSSAESVVHVNISNLRELFRERSIVGFFLVVIADVLEQENIAFLEGTDGLFHLFADAIVHESHRAMDHIRQLGRDGAQGH